VVSRVAECCALNEATQAVQLERRLEIIHVQCWMAFVVDVTHHKSMIDWPLLLKTHGEELG